jgi:hypothetical protein
MDRFFQDHAVPPLDGEPSEPAALPDKARSLAEFLRRGLAATPSQE